MWTVESGLRVACLEWLFLVWSSRARGSSAVWGSCGRYCRCWCCPGTTFLVCVVSVRSHERLGSSCESWLLWKHRLSVCPVASERALAIHASCPLCLPVTLLPRASHIPDGDVQFSECVCHAFRCGCFRSSFRHSCQCSLSSLLYGPGWHLCLSVLSGSFSLFFFVFFFFFLCFSLLCSLFFSQCPGKPGVVLPSLRVWGVCATCIVSCGMALGLWSRAMGWLRWVGALGLWSWEVG